MNYDLLIKARKVLDSLWRAAWLKGRCWGPKSEKNPYSTTNITFCIGSELVSISQSDRGLVVHEFQRATDTKLGKRVKDLLQRAGLMSVKIKEVISPQGYTWYCTACRKRGEIGPEGARDLVRKIDEEHARVSPRCHDPHIGVLDENLVKGEEIANLLVFEKVK